MLRRNFAILAMLALFVGSAIAAESVEKEDKSKKLWDENALEEAFGKFLEDVDKAMDSLDFFGLRKKDKKEEDKKDPEPAQPAVVASQGPEVDILAAAPEAESDLMGGLRRLFAVKKKSKEDSLFEGKDDDDEGNNGLYYGEEEDAEEEDSKKKEYIAKAKEFFADATGMIKDAFHKGAIVLKDAAKNTQDDLKTIKDSLEGVKLEDILSGDVRQYLPGGWESMSLQDLGLLSFDTYREDLERLGQWPPLKEDGTPYEPYEFATLYEDMETDFCTPEEFIYGEKVPAGCTGATVSLTLLPLTCTLDSISKELVCDPAKLVLTKIPASCNLKYKSASVYVGKSCALTKEIGFTKEVIIGGKTFDVILADKKKDYEADLDDLFEEFTKEVPEPAEPEIEADNLGAKLAKDLGAKVAKEDKKIDLPEVDAELFEA